MYGHSRFRGSAADWPRRIRVRTDSQLACPGFVRTHHVCAMCRYVYMVRKKLTSDVFAMKILRKTDMFSKNMMAQVMTERNVLSQSRTDSIVKLVRTHYTSLFHMYITLIMR